MRLVFHTIDYMDEELAMRAFVEQMLRVTVSLMQVEPNRWPVGIASGFIIPVEGRYRVISAGHAIAAKPNWAIETVPVSETKTLMLTVRNVHSLAKTETEMRTHEFDIAWADLYPEQLREQIESAPKKPQKPIEITLYEGPLDEAPKDDIPYGFAAWNGFEGHKDINKAMREARFELNLRYRGIEQSNGLYIFEPARQFQGKEYYEGASGSPIADPEGKIVSMLVGGDGIAGYLWGVPIAKYATVLTTP